jgi:outer membrane protein OmpA-like peptidoglycan-associated protein
MKKLILLAVSLTIIFTVNAQVLKRLGQRAKNKIEQKAGDKVDKGIDDAVDGNNNKKEKEKESEGTKETTSSGNSDNKSSDGSSSASSSSSSNSSEKAESAEPESMKAYTKYDFIPGEKVIAFEDFSKAEIGDFPERWNTNGTAEVVKLSTREGKWLKTNREAVFFPEFINDLPENFTLEFDLGVNKGWNSYPFHLNITKLKSPDKYADYGVYVRWQGDHTVHLNFKPAIGTYPGASSILVGKDGNHEISNEVRYTTWNESKNNFGHISIWRQKERLRVYLNGEKIWDLPKAFKADSKYSNITFAMQSAYHEDDFYVLGNIRLAVGAPDTRNKFMTEGKFVTTGILFDVNKDVIKPESYGTLKSIANVLSENADVKVKIVGHTDSDGDEKSNLDLSKRRAEAVKASLAKDFAIDESRMETDGKGESQPADKNDSVTGKANNRRVEFIKK